MNKLILLFVILMIPVYVSANYWYVDNSLVTSGSGQSWGSAWKSFNNIVWANVNPGDTIYISGGFTSQTYYESLTVGKSGAQNNLITITKGIDADHDGDVVIDPTAAGFCVIISQDHINVSGLHLIGEGVEIGGSTGVNVENNYINFSEGRGVIIESSDHIVVRNNYMESGAFVTSQTDGIYSGQNQLNLYEDNTIKITNQETIEHDDCIQLYQDTDITVKDNYLEQNNDQTNRQGLYATVMHGTTYYLNNVINMRNVMSNGMTFRRLPASGGDGNVVMIGNTVYSNRSQQTVWITDTDNPIVKNNIFFTNNAAPSLIIAGWAGNVSNIDYNLYYTGTSNKVVSFNGVTRSWTVWQGLGFDTHGMFANPNVVSLQSQDFHLLSSSPAIDAGADLGPPYNIDKDSIIRPQGAGWDIGAYEYINGTQCMPGDTPPCEGCITLIEISAYVGRWLNGQGVTLGDVSAAVSIWLGGCQ